MPRKAGAASKERTRAQAAQGEHHGVFRMGERERVARSRDAAVRMRYEGWELVQEATQEAQAPIEEVTTPESPES